MIIILTLKIVILLIISNMVIGYFALCYNTITMSLKVIALGTGICLNGCNSGPRRFPPGFLIEYNNELLLLDAAESVRYRIEDEGYDIGDIANIALTHVHPDHAAIAQLLQAKLCRVLWGESQPHMKEATVYMHEASAQGFEAVWNWHHPEAGGKLNHMPDKFQFKIEPIRSGWERDVIPGLTLKPFGVYHGFGQHPALGYRIETKERIIVYTGDAGITDSLFENVANADLLIADAGTRVGQSYTAGYGHMAPDQCGMLAAHSGVKELWLTHYIGLDEPPAMEAEVRKQGYNGALKIATDGLVWKSTS